MKWLCCGRPPNLIVYGGNYGGYLSRLDHKTGENRAISVWPDNPMGAGADVQKFRFQRNFPLLFDIIQNDYILRNVVRNENEGASWEQISPDLTIMIRLSRFQVAVR